MNSTYCSSCIFSYYLLKGTCYLICPSGYIGNNQICVNCSSPCLTCSNAITSCTSCLTNLTPSVYLAGNLCVIASYCPYGTFANILNNQCSTCISPCTVCTNSTYCISCIVGLSIYSGVCVSNCPDGYYSQSQICSLCISPCATCTASAISCDSCISNLIPPVFLIGKNCVLSSGCSNGYYPNISTSKC